MDLSIDQLKALIARKEQEQKEQAERDRLDQIGRDPARQLVPDSPSPRKKRRTTVAAGPDSTSTSARQPRPRISAPNFFDSTTRGPSSTTTSSNNNSSRRSLTSTDRVELRSGTGRDGKTQYFDHMSAVPKSVAEQLAEAKTIQRVKEERIAKRHRASTSSSAGTAAAANGFPYASTSRDSLDALVNGRTGSATRLSEKGKTVPIGSKDDKGRTPSRSGNQKTTSTQLQVTDPKPTGPAMARAVPTPLAKPSAPKPARSASTAAYADFDDNLEITGGPRKRTRNKDGTWMEEVTMGPREFQAPPDDPEWNRLEPYSGIQLKERVLSHEQVDDLLVGRYQLTPSQIYSLARIDSRQRIDLDPEQVDADFVVIGVLAWKDEIRFLNSNALGSGKAGARHSDKKGKKVASASEDEDDDEEDSDEDSDGSTGGGAARAKRKQRKVDAKKEAASQKEQQDTLFRAPNRRQRRQQYVRFSLVDLSSTSASASATGQLSLMLVQADAEDKAINDDGNEVSVYKGQSGGAYEKFWKESAGAVVAIINPTFLPYHKDFSYTLKPTSEASMVVIGRAENLAFCEAIKADGKRCGKWVDARTGRTCQFHVELAIKRTGVRRAETSSNTASLSQKGTFNSSNFKKSLGSAASKLCGKSPPPKLAPVAQMIAGTTTYVTSTGNRSSGRAGGPNGGPLSTLTLPASRAGGGFVPGFREGAIVSEEKKRLKRQAEDDKRARRELRELVGRDKGKTPGGEYLERARRGKENSRGSKKRKGADSSSDDGDAGSRGNWSGTGEGDEEDRKPAIQSVFKAEALRRIGFNPTAKPGELQKDESEEARQYRLALEDGMANRSMKLTAPPGPKVRSGVKAPEVPTRKAPSVIPSEDEDDDLVIEGGPADGGKLPLPRIPKST